MRLTADLRQLADDLWATGPSPVPLYLATGDAPVLFDAGISAFGPEYLRAVGQICAAGPRPRLNLLTHVHWDHCGAASFLRRRLPGLETGCGEGGAALLAEPAAAAQIRRLNGAAGAGETAFAPFAPELELLAGMRFRISRRLSVEVIPTPGHTRESVAFFLPEIRALIGGEAIGVPSPGGHVSAEFLVDYDAYQSSLRRLEALRPRIVCMAHFLAFTEGDAESYLARARQAAARFRVRLERLLEMAAGDRDVVFRTMKAADYDAVPEPKQPPSAYALNLRAQIRLVAAQRAGAGAPPGRPVAGGGVRG